MYKEKLPEMDKLIRLTRLVGPFPASARRIAFYAGHFGLGHDVVSFLHLFRPSEVFESRADFVNRSYELLLIISEERQMPKEVMYSPQG